MIKKSDKILVAGHNGLVGSAIVRKLKSKGYKKIITANNVDIDNALKKGLKDSMIDRLVLNEKRIASMKDGLAKIISIPDTLYKTSRGIKQKNGISVSQMRVPLGVIAVSYTHLTLPTKRIV